MSIGQNKLAITPDKEATYVACVKQLISAIESDFKTDVVAQRYKSYKVAVDYMDTKYAEAKKTAAEIRAKIAAASTGVSSTTKNPVTLADKTRAAMEEQERKRTENHVAQLKEILKKYEQSVTVLKALAQETWGPRFDKKYPGARTIKPASVAQPGTTFGAASLAATKPAVSAPVPADHKMRKA